MKGEWKGVENDSTRQPSTGTCVKLEVRSLIE